MASPNPKKRTRKLGMEMLEDRRVMATLPFGAEAEDTGEFMLGRVAVTPVFLESDGTIDQNTENWTSSHTVAVLNNIRQGLNWWTDLLATKSSVHTLEWVLDTSYATQPHPTPYEPIFRSSNAYNLWVSDFLSDIGYSASPNLESNIRDFNNAQREKLDTDWSFTIFVVNSVNDGDGSFAPGGSFARAFAFAGGLFQVVPSTRPASTFAHETGHLFWARDEYAGGGEFGERRGYYNAQNTNAIDRNPDPNFQQALSIMSAGSNLQAAYSSLVTADASLAQIGWVDSDNDGIFDVLDVPLKLEGTGRLNTVNGLYRFVGKASPQTLPNRNSWGTQNDITLNRIGRIEYRIDNGPWTTALTPNRYLVDIDVSIPVSSNQQRIEIRAIDPRIGITSNVFEGTLGNLPDTTTKPGIQGFVWNDLDNDNTWDANESGYVGASVLIVDNNSVPINLQRSVEPDDFGIGFFSNQTAGVRLDVIGADASGSIGIFNDANASTGTRVFRPFSRSAGSYVEAFDSTTRQLRVRFDSPTSYVSIDAIAIADNTDVRVDAFAVDGSLIKRTEQKGMINGQKLTLDIGTDTAQIASVIVRGINNSSMKLDNLRFGPRSSVRTASDGSYALPNLVAGSYRLIVQPETQAVIPSNGSSGIQTVVLTTGGTVSHTDFGLHRLPSPWRNPNIPEDVNDSGSVEPLDALILINEINANQARSLDGSGLTNPPYLDVNGDRAISPLDILQVINYINRRGSGEGENRASTTVPAKGDYSSEQNGISLFPSFAFDLNANQPNSWIVSNSNERNRRQDVGPDRCNCPACASCAPAGEYSSSILDIAKAAASASPTSNDSVMGPKKASPKPATGPSQLPNLGGLDAYLATWNNSGN